MSENTYGLKDLCGWIACIYIIWKIRTYTNEQEFFLSGLKSERDAFFPISSESKHPVTVK